MWMRRGGTGVGVTVTVGVGAGEGGAGAVVPVGDGGRLVGVWVVAANGSSSTVVDWLFWVFPGIRAIAVCVGSTASAAGMAGSCVSKLQPINPNRLPTSSIYRAQVRGVVIAGNVVLSKLSFLVPLLYRIDPAA